MMNFNDLAASFVTLFHIMIVNNWFLTCDMFTIVTGSILPRIYFVCFWCIVVLVILNLIISLMIEIYSSVAAETEKEFKRRDSLAEIQQKVTEFQDTNHMITPQGNFSDGDL